MNRRDFISLITKAIALSPLAKFLPQREYTAPLAEAFKAFEGTLMVWAKYVDPESPEEKQWRSRVITWGMDADNGVRVMREYVNGELVKVSTPPIDPQAEARKRLFGNLKFAAGPSALIAKQATDEEIKALLEIN